LIYTGFIWAIACQISKLLWTKNKDKTELAQTFLERGLITQEDYEILVAGIDLRDRMMFKREKVTVDPKLVYQTIEVVQRFFSQVESVKTN
jgi:predicted regulator of amino acid metabolism with ACT domain